MRSPAGEGSYCTVLAGLESRAPTRKAAACYRAFRTGFEVLMRLFQPMLPREADYLHPQLRGFKPIFIIVPCHIGKKHMYFFPLIPSTVKLVKCVHRIVLSMWVNMPEEEAVGRNSIFIHLMKGLPSPSCKICQGFPAFSFCCSEFHILIYTGSRKCLRERLVGALVSSLHHVYICLLDPMSLFDPSRPRLCLAYLWSWPQVRRNGE